MSDLKEALECLRTDVSTSRLAPAATIRQETDRHRRRVALALLPAVAAVAVIAAGALHGGPEARDGIAALGTEEAQPEQPFLPRPWTLVSEQRTTMAAAMTAGDRFCDVASNNGGLPATRQTLSDGRGVVRVYEVTTADFAAAGNLFKKAYSECSRWGAVTSTEGPALHWQSPDGVEAAALWDNDVVYFLSADSAGSAVDLDLVVADLTAAVGDTCDQPVAGQTCPP